ncbi:MULTISPECIES: carboxymuconolactone decarboxylase family protein [Novosphingobium]|jgi:hypothetical protein|uniref:Carboxymuconolactone decarboxylase family protein n=2 Tax=Sphingomonadales TaxID=204457 RepID=A0ABT5WU59_9SPHN|nr:MULTISPECIES: carboxymuconolactone decarboxylase family protein [Novosphingobium]EZP67600.1 hypothetical protein BV96_04335 [Sphingomonas paucimobilis]MDE8653427.1 carboxymuconolactone decarboxylase family protein [Novosphingobium album (ex Liu et al. 2023)]
MSARIERLGFEQLAPGVQYVLRSKYERLGYLGEFFQVTGVQPVVLTSFMEMTDALKVALPEHLTELGALTVATLMENRYELHQHERLSKRLGFGEAWIAAVEQADPDVAPELSDAERDVQRLIIAMLRRRGKDVQAELDKTIEAIGAEEAIAVMFLVGRYVTHALIVNSLDLQPPVPSIFDRTVK